MYTCMYLFDINFYIYINRYQSILSWSQYLFQDFGPIGLDACCSCLDISNYVFNGGA